MVQTAALLKPSQKVLDAIKEYTVKIDSETISDLPLKATLIYEALQKYNVSPATLADVLGKSPEIVNIYLNQRIDPNLLMDFYGVPYREIDRAKVERQIRAEKQALAITYSGGMSDDWYTNDMAKKLATRGISDLQDFAAHQNDLVLPIGTAVRVRRFGDEYGGTIQYFYEYDDERQYDIDSSKVKIKESFDPEGNIVTEYVLTEPITLDLGVDYFYNKTNGKKFSQSAGNVWESAYEGKGGVYYKVKFTNTGLPVFYTQHFETGWKAEISPFLPFIAIVGAAVGLPLLVGESILGAVGITVESTAISATIGNVAVNTVLTGGDVGAALAKSAAGAAGGYVGDFAGTGLDSVEMGKIAGAAATAAIQGAIDESVYPTLEGFKWNKTFFSMNSTPLSGNHIAMGVFFNSLIRVVFTAVIYWFVMLAFGVLESPRAWLAIFTAIMAGAAFGAMMQALAGLLENENIFFTVLNRFVIMPLFLFSGTFYPLTNMPIYLQWIGWISPLWHATELGRWLTYSHEISSLMLYVHFIFLNSLLLIGIIASRRIFTRRLGK